jgi:hypothetical protein
MNRSFKPHGNAITTLRNALEEKGFELEIYERAPASGRATIDPDRDEKYCPVCETIKSREEYPMSKSTKDRMHSICKECSAIEVSCTNLRHKTDEALMESIETDLRRVQRSRWLLEGKTPREIAKIEQGRLEA